MNLFFSILSVAYIAGIFLFADSPVVSDIAAFNPYSLLHIPLYGVLTILIILSLLPPRLLSLNRPLKVSNDLNVPNGHNDRLVSPFLIVYNVTGVETNGFQTCDIARVKEIPGKLPG